MARRSDHSKEEIKDMALTAAGKIVTEETYAGLSARKIAKEIGYTVGTLYLVFENLDDLILQVNVRTLNGLYSHLKQSTDKCREPRTCIIAMGRAYVEFAALYPERWKLIFDHNLPQDVPVPDWYRKKIASIFDLIELQLQPLLTSQSKRKLIQTARTLWCGVHGICALAVTNKLENNGVESIQVLTDSLINYFLIGLQQDIEGGAIKRV